MYGPGPAELLPNIASPSSGEVSGDTSLPGRDGSRRSVRPARRPTPCLRFAARCIRRGSVREFQAGRGRLCPRGASAVDRADPVGGAVVYDGGGIEQPTPQLPELTHFAEEVRDLVRAGVVDAGAVDAGAVDQHRELRVRFAVPDEAVSELHRRTFGGSAQVVRPWARRLSDHSLSWVGAFSPTTTRSSGSSTPAGTAVPTSSSWTRWSIPTTSAAASAAPWSAPPRLRPRLCCSRCGPRAEH